MKQSTKYKIFKKKFESALSMYPILTISKLIFIVSFNIFVLKRSECISTSSQTGQVKILQLSLKNSTFFIPMATNCFRTPNDRMLNENHRWTNGKRHKKYQKMYRQAQITFSAHRNTNKGRRAKPNDKNFGVF